MEETMNLPPTDKANFNNATLYTQGYCWIRRMDCRHLKFWWGPYEKSTSQHFDRVLHLVYTPKGKRTSEHLIECHPVPIYALIVDTRRAIDPPSSHVKDERNPMVLNQRYSYNDPRLRADFDEMLAAACVPLLADFRGMEPSKEVFRTYADTTGERG
jgi:hypothetical protein